MVGLSFNSVDYQRVHFVCTSGECQTSLVPSKQRKFGLVGKNINGKNVLRETIYLMQHFII